MLKKKKIKDSFRCWNIEQNALGIYIGPDFQILTACEKVEKSDKLLKIKLSLGYEERQVVSGIAQYYTPEEMVGKKVVLVANLKPARLRGVDSQGMILCAEDGDKVSIIEPDSSLTEGSRIR